MTETTCPSCGRFLRQASETFSPSSHCQPVRSIFSLLMRTPKVHFQSGRLRFEVTNNALVPDHDSLLGAICVKGSFDVVVDEEVYRQGSVICRNPIIECPMVFECDLDSVRRVNTGSSDSQ